MTARTLPELDDIRDAGIAVDFVHWGNPYHGTIEGSTLTLPNDDTLTLPAALTHNACFEFRVPGAPGALDENGDPAPAPVAGGEWRDYLLLYGDCKHVYGKAVATSAVNWLYAHPDGSRWLISITSATSGIALSSAALAIDFKAVRFGDMGGVPETVYFTLTLADRGLSPAPAGVVEAMPASVSICVSDITPDGGKCCLMFYDTKSGSEATGERFPYGFFEVVLDAGVFSASTVSVVHDLSAVAGTRQGGAFTQTDDNPTPTQCDIFNGFSTPTSDEAYVRDAIMACWYDADDALVAIKVNSSEPLVASTYTISYRPFYVLGSETDCPEPYYVHETRHSAKVIAFGASDFVAYTYSATYAYDESGTHVYGEDSPTQYTASTLLSGNGETVYSKSVIVPLSSPVTHINGEFAQTFNQNVNVPPILLVAQDQPVNLNGDMHPWQIRIGPVQDVPLIFAKRFSATLIGIGRTWIDATTSARKTEIDKFMTPAGLFNNAYTIPDDVSLSDLSATFHPVAHEIVIAADGAWRAFV